MERLAPRRLMAAPYHGGAHYHGGGSTTTGEAHYQAGRHITMAAAQSAGQAEAAITRPDCSRRPVYESRAILHTLQGHPD